MVPAELEKLQKALDATDAEARAASGKVSDVCRNIGIGSLAIFYALLLADKEPAASFYKSYSFTLTLIALAGAITFLFDYLQYFFGYLHLNNRLLLFKQKDISISKLNQQQKSYFNTMSRFSFWSKSIFAGICCASLVYVVGDKAIKTRTDPVSIVGSQGNLKENIKDSLEFKDSHGKQTP